MSRLFRSSILRVSAVAVLLSGLALPSAHAESKEMIQLQTQVQALMDAVARLQQSNDERMGVLKDLVQQTADSVNKMSVDVNGMKLSLQNQQDALSTKSDQLAGQVQGLNDSLDELKARMARMEKSLGDIQSQQQSAAAILNNLPQGGGAMPAANGPAGAGPASGQPIPAGPPQATAAPTGPSSQDMYRTAYSDYMAAKYPLATSEFNDLIKAYPNDTLSGNALFYLGEIDIRTQKPTAAVKLYDRLIERYPDNSKIPAAQLHKAQAMLAMKQNEAAVREMRSLIQRYPTSPEAAQARMKLNALHAAE